MQGKPGALQRGDLAELGYCQSLQGFPNQSVIVASDVFLLFLQICTAEVEVLMTRLQNTFRQELSGVGASLEKRWKFCGFDGLKMT